MPPRKRPSSKNTNNPPPPPPPLQIDLETLQAAITATISATLSQLNPSGSGGGTQTQNPEGNQGHRKECSYKDFMNAKSTFFDGIGVVIGLTRCLENIESIFEICACSESDKVKFAACTLTDKALT